MNMNIRDNELRVLHISLFRKAGAGHIVQLSAEVDAAVQLKLNENCRWETESWVSISSENPDASFEYLVPAVFRHPRVAPLYLWARILRRYRQYDYVFLRYPMPDFFSWLFAPLIPNLVTVHHTKEIEEFGTLPPGLRRSVATFIESKIQPRSFRNLIGLVGVTDEIAAYELERFPRTPHVGVMPNGTVVNRAPTLDQRTSQLEIAFVASYFYPWHGLDLFLDAINNHLVARGSANDLVIHLVGELNEDQQESIANLVHQGASIVCHGLVNAEELQEILARCHVALGSFALWRNGLYEASTLKVREYLAAGLPVYAGHKDSGLPEEFPFYLQTRELSIEELISFAESMRNVKRGEVVKASTRYINKSDIMAKQVGYLRSWQTGPRCASGDVA